MSTRQLIRAHAKAKGWEAHLEVGSSRNDQFTRGNEIISVWYTSGREALMYAIRSDKQYTGPDHVKSANYAQCGDHTRNKRNVIRAWMSQSDSLEGVPFAEPDETDGQPVADLTATAVEVIRTDVINDVLAKMGVYEAIENLPRIKDDQDTNGLIQLIAFLAGRSDRLAEEVQKNIEIRNTIRGYLGTI